MIVRTSPAEIEADHPTMENRNGPIFSTSTYHHQAEEEDPLSIAADTTNPTTRLTDLMRTAGGLLEQARQLETEREAWTWWTIKLLQQHPSSSSSSSWSTWPLGPPPDSEPSYDPSSPPALSRALHLLHQAAGAGPDLLRLDDPGAQDSLTTTTWSTTASPLPSGAPADAARTTTKRSRPTASSSSGQWTRTLQRNSAPRALQHLSQVLAKRLKTERASATPLAQAVQQLSSLRQNHPPDAPSGSSPLLTAFDQLYQELLLYHASSALASRPLESTALPGSTDSLPVAEEEGPWKSALRQTLVDPLVQQYQEAPEEVLGKYVDLHFLYRQVLRMPSSSSSSSSTPPETNPPSAAVSRVGASLAHLADNNEQHSPWGLAVFGAALSPSKNKKTKAAATLTYCDFLQALLQGVDAVLQLPSNSSNGASAFLCDEAIKLQHRKKYARFLQDLQQYLIQFWQRSHPGADLLPPEQQLDPLLQEARDRVDETWRQVGGVPPLWSAKPSEAGLAAVTTAATEETAASIAPSAPALDWSRYASAQEVADQVDGDRLKVLCAQFGLKCGGTVLDRAQRLWLTKDRPREEWPRKILAKSLPASSPPAAPDTAAPTMAQVVGAVTRLDLARLEARVVTLLDQLRPTLEATLRRAERRLTQTLRERDREVEEELFGAELPTMTTNTTDAGAKNDGDEDEDSDEDAPIYNPKNVPLDFDGKPIPYWLFKLHGLNHYYPCEICGGESYRGRRMFELHFAEQRHAQGMRSLGIPNTKHFHGMTRIEDAQQLWRSLQEKLQNEQFDELQEEEYEDQHGNVLSRTAYEDLARQGLL